MALSDDLLSQFAKATKDTAQESANTTVHGTAVLYNGKTYVKLDGSDLLTPVTPTADTHDGERVTVEIKNHTAIVTGNISSPAARVDDIQDMTDVKAKMSEFETVIAGKVNTEELAAESGRIDVLVSETATIKGELTASKGEIDELQTDVLTVTEKITAAEGEITKLKTDKLDAAIAEITYATIAGLEVVDADVHNLEATYGNISSLMFGSATGSTIQTSFSNAVITQLGDAQIKSAMIESVVADKITSGDIITNQVRVKSEDGKLLISDETIQISDDTRVRIQIGKDAVGDYSINVWDADGNLMLSEGGITDSAIKDAIIRNDMIRDDANIAAHKLDIDSLFDEINDSSKTIKSTQIYLDDEEQTLDVAFKAVTTDIGELQNGVSSQGTSIEMIQGQITSKIWQQDIDSAKSEMSTQYSALEQELGGISATVASHESSISTISDQVTTVEADLDGFKTSVSETYATKTDVSDHMTSMQTSIDQNASSIVTTAERASENAIAISFVQQTADELSVQLTSVEKKADDAAKKATNYLEFSDSGLVVGDMTADELGKNVRIDSDSVDIRNGEDVLASFGANTVTLGQNSEDSVISLCDGAATISALVSESSTSYPKYDSMQLDSQKIVMNSQKFNADTTGSGDSYTNTANMDLLSYTTAGVASAALNASVLTNSSKDKSQVGVLASADDSSTSSYVKVYSEFWDESASAWTSNSMSMYPTYTRFSKYISINGNKITGANNVLWSGGMYMTSGHTATFSQAVSAQTNGIVLVFSEYYDGEAKNQSFHTFFIPKELVAEHNGAGHVFQMSTSNLAYYATKYLYISDTKLTGHDNNDDEGETDVGITRTNKRFVLRYVIGV